MRLAAANPRKDSAPRRETASASSFLALSQHSLNFQLLGVRSIERAAIRRGVDPQEAAGRHLDVLAEDTKILERFLDIAIPDDRREARAA